MVKQKHSSSYDACSHRGNKKHYDASASVISSYSEKQVDLQIGRSSETRQCRQQIVVCFQQLSFQGDQLSHQDVFYFLPVKSNVKIRSRNWTECNFRYNPTHEFFCIL